MAYKKPFLTIVVPVYNETGRLDNLFHIDRFLKNKKFKSELIVVDDGSTDNTLNKLKSFLIKIKIISYPINQGKGFAIKQGILAAKGKYCLFTDLDLSTPLEEFDNFYPLLKKYDVIIGSRIIEGSRLVERQSRLRENLGKGFTLLSGYILQLKISDFTCGFKCFSEKATKEIFPRLKINRWGYDSEILFIAKTKGLKIREIPVKWSNDPRTKVKLPKDLISSFSELLQIRYNHFKNIYK